MFSPSLISSKIPILQTAQIMNHKDEGFLFRKLEEVFNVGPEAVASSDDNSQLRFYQVVLEKLQVEFECMKTHFEFVDMSLLRDILGALFIVSSDLNISRELIKQGVLDIMVEYLSLEIPLSNDAEVMTNQILKLQGLVMKVFSELTSNIESSQTLLEWISSGRVLVAIISLLERVAKSSEGIPYCPTPRKGQAQPTTTETTILLNRIIVKYIVKLMMDLSRVGCLQHYSQISLNLPQYQFTLNKLPSLLFNDVLRISPSEKQLVFKILANLVDVPRMSCTIFNQIPFIPMLLESMLDREMSLVSFYVFVQISRAPQVVS